MGEHLRRGRVATCRRFARFLWCVPFWLLRRRMMVSWRARAAEGVEELRAFWGACLPYLRGRFAGVCADADERFGLRRLRP